MPKFVALMQPDGEMVYVNPEAVEVISHPIEGIDNPKAKCLLHFASGTNRAVTNPIMDVLGAIQLGGA